MDKTKRQETIEYLKTLGINADERFTNWEQHNNPELEDETGTGGLWDLSRTIMNELSEDEMQTLIYGLLCMLGDIKWKSYYVVIWQMQGLVLSMA